MPSPPAGGLKFKIQEEPACDARHRSPHGNPFLLPIENKLHGKIRQSIQYIV